MTTTALEDLRAFQVKLGPLHGYVVQPIIEKLEHEYDGWHVEYCAEEPEQCEICQRYEKYERELRTLASRGVSERSHGEDVSERLQGGGE